MPHSRAAEAALDIRRLRLTVGPGDKAEFSGHRLPAGFLVSAAKAGANIFKMVEVSRHRNIETVRGYVRCIDIFKNHAGIGLL